MRRGDLSFDRETWSLQERMEIAHRGTDASSHWVPLTKARHAMGTEDPGARLSLRSTQVLQRNCCLEGQCRLSMKKDFHRSHNIAV